MRYLLASASPRRRMLMKEISDTFDVCSVNVDESAIEDAVLSAHSDLPVNEAADLMVRELSLAKALAAYRKMGDAFDIIIGADTTVALEDEILGKPADRADAVRMLRKQSCMPESVITGVTIIKGGVCHTFSETSKVVFKALDDMQERKIQEYCDTPEPYDKAGAYGIQFGTDGMIDYYEGDMNNIIGFPVDRIKRELELL